MLHAELQSRILILLSLQWDQIELRLPRLALMIDRDVMAACATRDLEQCEHFTRDLHRARLGNMGLSIQLKLIKRHLQKWLVRLFETR